MSRVRSTVYLLHHAESFNFYQFISGQNHFSISIKYQLRKKIDDINLDLHSPVYTCHKKKYENRFFFNV